MLDLKQDLTRTEQKVINFISAHEELGKDLANELKCVKENQDRRITQLEGIVDVQLCIIIPWGQVEQLRPGQTGFILAYCSGGFSLHTWYPTSKWKPFFKSITGT